jgi:hypothetical protein
VCSSTMFNSFRRRRSAVSSNSKSRPHTWFGCAARSSVPSIPPGRRFLFFFGGGRRRQQRSSATLPSA